MKSILLVLSTFFATHSWAPESETNQVVAKVQAEDKVVSIAQGSGSIKLSDYNAFNESQRLIVCRSALLEILLSGQLDLTATKITSIAAMNGFSRQLQKSFTKLAKQAEDHPGFEEFTVETYLLSMLINAKIATARK